MADQNNQQAYPSGVDPRLLDANEVQHPNSLSMEDNELVQKEEEQNEHIGFIRKVLGIVAAQMFLTFAMATAASLDHRVAAFVRNPIVIMACSILLMLSMCTLICSKSARRTVPTNYFWLACFTFAESVFIASVAALMTVESVLTAIMATCVVTFCLFLAALHTASSTNRDQLLRNMLWGVVGAVLLQLVFILMVILTWSFNDQWWIVGSSVLCCLVTGIYIVFALIIIIIPGVTDKDDYILGALRLYMEIARLFYYVLIILGDRK
eukprot:Macronucleus_1772.p1 GENE.Macronucleus_1772~~Macronucleus_1772.p1  ORF type:complete len:266 (+),score=27.70 Macronucleus_1772:1-798(+)